MESPAVRLGRAAGDSTRFQVDQVIVSPVEQHSKKPDMIRERIVSLMGDLPRVELFARQRVPGWDAWGNEVEPSPGLAEELTHENLP